MPKKRRNKNWSYNAGERGRNWVRAYRQKRDGRYYVEWLEDGRRRAVLLKGVTDPAEAKKRADELAARFADLVLPAGPLTVRSLMTIYMKEVTPTKKAEGSREYDTRAERIWGVFFDTQQGVRKGTRHPATLDRLDWDRFVVCRREGRIPGWGQVRDRAVEKDLKWLVAVLNWAVGASLLSASPWSTEVRRAQGWVMPKEKNPKRPGMDDDLRAGIGAHARNWQLGAMMVLGYETRRRNNAIRQLSWDDINQEDWVVKWREDSDKVGREDVVPLSERAIEVLKGLPSRGIGQTPVFPSQADPRKPVSGGTARTWMTVAKNTWLASVPDDERPALVARLRRVGFHAELRSGVRDPGFRGLPAKLQETIAGKSFEMLTKTYDQVTVRDIRDQGGAIGIPKTG